MAEINTCIFDLDGVIVDTAKYHFKAWKRLCKELGFDLSEEENEMLKGISRVESLEILLKKGGVSLSPKEKESALTRKNEWYLGYVDAMDRSEILPGVVDFMEKVKKSGRKTALGSASKNAMRILEKIQVVSLFDTIIDGTKVTRGKPDPQTFLLGAEATQTRAENCVVFEDAAAGIEAAKAGGMYAVGVGDPEVLYRADRIIPGFEEVDLELLLAL